MKKSLLTLLISCLLLGVSGETFGASGTYYIWDDWGPGTPSWIDVEKDLPNTDDDLMCWAAAASNILDWTGWDGGVGDAEAIFDHFLAHWADDGGWPKWGWEWWWDGTYDGPLNPPNTGWSNPDPGGGGFYTLLNFNDYYHENFIMAQQMLALDEYLHAGYGTTVGLYGGGGHRVTVWGFDWDDTNNDYYTAIWITDSDDDKGGSPPRPDTLRRYTVTWDGTKWELGGGYTGWYLDRAMALEQRPIPAPGALILAGIGAVSIGWIRKRRSI